MTDEDLMRLAKRRIYAKRAFWVHLFTYVLVNAFLIALYFLADGSGHFWPLWVISGWGVGLLAHGVVLLISLSGRTTDGAIQAEYERLKAGMKSD